MFRSAALSFPSKASPPEMPGPRDLHTPAATGGSVGDVVEPKAGQLRLSPTAIDGRMRRVFTPNTKGEYKVSAEIVKQWRTKKGRKNLQQLFQSCGFNTDWGIENGFCFGMFWGFSLVLFY